MGMINTRWILAGLLPLVLAVFVRAWFAAAFLESPLFTPLEGQHDRTLYHEAAREVADGKHVPDGSFQHMPLYPWVLGAGYAAFGDDLRVSATLGIACDVVTVLLIVLLAARLGARPIPAGVVAGLYALYPLAIVYATLTMPNTLNTLLLTATALALTGLHDRKTGAWAGVGLLCGITALGFAGMLPVAVVFLLWRLTNGWRRDPGPWKGILLFAVAFALPLIPVAVHNTRAEGAFVLLTTHGGFNFYMGNHERATGYPVRVRDFRMTARAMLEDAHRAAEQETGRTLTRAESSEWWFARGRAFWRESPGEAVMLTLKKAALFWNFREVDDLRMLEQLRLTDGLFRTPVWPGFAGFGLLGLIGLLYARGSAAAKTVLLTGMASIVLFFITARYRLTFVPLMAALGAAGLAGLWAKFRARDLQLWWLIPAAVIVAYPFPVRDLRPFDYLNASVQVLGAGRPEYALALAREGLEIDPRNADLWFAGGNAMAALERYEEAVDYFAQAVRANPAHAIARYNLALSLARLGRVAEAVAVLEEWVTHAPHDRRAAALYRDLKAVLEAP